MKKLLLFMLTGLSLGLSAAELDSIGLITPVSYSRSRGYAQTLRSKFLATAASTFNVDIERKVLAQIAPYRRDLAVYYPRAGELDTFIRTVIQTGIRTHLSTSMSDANLIKFYGHLGNNLIGKFADKILEKEGVTDPARRNLWVAKLTQPFNSCIASANNSQYDANHCIEALTASLVPSTGIALVYELSRAKLNSTLPAGERAAFNNQQTVLYKSCVARTKATASDVTTCALGAMKNGVLRVTNTALTRTINEKASSPAKAASIRQVVWPAFETCTNRVGQPSVKTALPDQFINCIDTLISDTGALIVQDKISTTKTVRALFSASETKRLADEKSAQFKRCAADQKRKGAEENGILDISVCEKVITNEVTYRVVSEMFRGTARNSNKDNKSMGIRAGNQGVALLDRCWNNLQSNAARENCLRQSIVGFSQNIATIKLNDAIPASMPGKAELTSTSVANLGRCINQVMPPNISEAENLSEKIDNCAGRLTRTVAMRVADYQIRDTAKDNLSASETDILIRTLVQDEFSRCIGETPDDKRLEGCISTLTIKTAKRITEISFKNEVDKYLRNNGGVDALGINQAAVDSFLLDLNKTNTECLDKRVTGTAINHVNSCVKFSIQKIAFFFGNHKFNQNIGKMYDGRETDKQAIIKQFRDTLAACLAKKDGDEFTINDYTRNLDTCSHSVSGTTTLLVGQDQINTSLDQYLKDRPGLNLSAKREELRAALIGNFKTCMSTSANQNACIDSLKRDATKAIVLNYGKIEIKAQLNADSTPAQLKPVEDAFSTCTDAKLEGDALATHLDECTKNFALGFAKELGGLKLTSLLKSSLGTLEFNNQKSAIDGAVAEYNSCLEGLRKYNLKDLTSKLTTCTDGLTSRGLAIVRGSINTWMSTGEKDEEIKKLKREFANFIPCLSGLLPASPYTQELQQNVDSAIKPAVIMIAHYIEYDPDNAKETLSGIIQKLSIDLHDVAATQKAKEELLDFLYQNGALDQFIKGMVRGTVKDTLALLSERDVPKNLREALLKKQNYEEIFNTPEGLRVKDAVMEKLLKPALLNNADLQGEAMKNNMAAIKDNVIKLMIDSPSFGQQALKMGIQNQINEMGKITRFFAKILYGGDALKWEKVRTTNDGKTAEDYIRENVLTPKFRGVEQTEAEKKRIMAEAERLVTKAVKSYSDNK